MSPEDERHGTTRGYHAGCREACCRAAIARYEKRGRLARLSDGRSVPALGAQRRIQALMRLGWTSTDIADAAGWNHRNSVFRIIKGQKGKPCRWLERQTHETICDVYKRLSMLTPDPKPCRARTQRLAERNGWPPPLAWDDIDNPDERPKRAAFKPRTNSTADHLLSEWEHLRGLGVSIHQAAKQLGVTVEAIELAVRRRERNAA